MHRISLTSSCNEQTKNSFILGSWGLQGYIFFLIFAPRSMAICVWLFLGLYVAWASSEGCEEPAHLCMYSWTIAVCIWTKLLFAYYGSSYTPIVHMHQHWFAVFIMTKNTWSMQNFIDVQYGLPRKILRYIDTPCISLCKHSYSEYPSSLHFI